MGSSITLHFTRKRCARFVVCAVVKCVRKYCFTNKNLPTVRYICTCKDGKMKVPIWGYLGAWRENDHNKTRYIESDHVFLGHDFFIKSQRMKDGEEDSLTIDFDVVVQKELEWEELSFDDIRVEVCDDIQVEKCGVFYDHMDSVEKGGVFYIDPEEESVDGSIGSHGKPEEESVEGSNGSDEEQESEKEEQEANKRLKRF